MVTTARTPAEQRSVLVAAREALAELAHDATRLSAAEVAEVMALVDQVGAQAGAARVGLAVENARRDGLASRELGSWVAEHAPSLRQGGAAAVARLAGEVLAPSRTAALSGSAPVEPDPASPVGIVWGCVREGVLQPANALTVLAEERRLQSRLVPEAVPTVTRALVGLVVAHGTSTMKRLRPRLLAQHGALGELDKAQERLRSGAYLTPRWVESADVTRYELVMTPEQAATLEAAIGPLARPAPNEETTERDHRPSGQRRVEALTEVCRRSAGIDAENSGRDGTAGTASAVHVMVTLADLEERTGCAEVLGSAAAGTVIGPEQLRKIACDAALVPYVLGAAGEVLEQGMSVRLFTRAQRRRLTIRDRHCTYPGCHTPAHWCRAHHVRHWADAGATDLNNAALLCENHHTLVHARQLWADVREQPDEHGRYVTWNLHPGSYDRALAALRDAETRERVRERAEQDAQERLLAIIGRARPEPAWTRDQLDAWYTSCPENHDTDDARSADTATTDEHRRATGDPVWADAG
ncbi:MAG: HNH endonuclease signature motif containing protein [Dermatophilaceae bacterium]